MRTAFRWEAILLLGVGVFGGLSGARGADRTDWIISPALLGHAGLEIVWQQALPLKRGEDFETIALEDGRLYLRSGRNYLWSLDRNEGRIVFSRSIAPPDIPVLGLESYDDSLIMVVGNQLVEMDNETGTEERVSDLELSIVAPPTRNDQFFYVPAADRRLHALRVTNLVRLFKVATENDALVTSVLADDQHVVFGTDAGNVVGMEADAPRKLWQFDAPGAVAGPVIRDGDTYYFASEDTNVYRIDVVDRTTATMAWKFQTEAVLDRAPRVTGDFLYQYAVGRGLTAVDKQTGEAVWSRPEGVDLLAEQGSRAFIITDRHTLAVMDNAAGRRVYFVNFAPVTGYASNVVDSLIYIADAQGRVACLRPIR